MMMIGPAILLGIASAGTAEKWAGGQEGRRPRP